MRLRIALPALLLAIACTSYHPLGWGGGFSGKTADAVAVVEERFKAE
jgi:hypothetical protein